jgi:hypothetical protein
MTTWTVAILSSRETAATLAATVSAALRAVGQQDALFDVVVNGNPALAQAMAQQLDALPLGAAPNAVLRLWDLPLGDKAHAWNTYLHQVWPGSDLAFFIDGYVAVRSDALALLDSGLAARPDAIAATGVPTIGRTARQLRERLLREGGTHGNFHALRGETMRRFRDAGFRLPLGLYRTDALLNSVMALNLDPASHEWDARRVLVHAEATWQLRPLLWYRPADLLTHLRRLRRQAYGEVEKQAFAHHLVGRRRPPSGLPATAHAMVASWIGEARQQVEELFRRRPLLRLAARQLLAAQRDWSRRAEPPRLLATRGPGPAIPVTEQALAATPGSLLLAAGSAAPA